MAQPLALLDHVARCLRGAPRITSAELARALRTCPDVGEALAHARFDGSTYVRVPLYGCSDWEVRLLCWAPGQSSALHGHGDSACAFRVVTGEATELGTDGSVRTLRVGDVAEATPDTVHQVANLGKAPLVSLHVYGPPLPVDQPSADEGRRIVIVGGGFSGVALAVHLLRSGDPSLRITIVEPGPHLGRGVAYGGGRHEHRLNVPAVAMSIDPADPEDFLRYAREVGAEVGPMSLAPRPLYGDYVQRRLEQAIVGSRAKLRLARSAAVAVRRAWGRWLVELEDGRTLAADDVALATGHGPPRVPEALDALGDHPALVRDPSPQGALERVGLRDRVLIVGTGLSAVDVLVTLRSRGHEGPIHAVSRNGRWPRPHLDPVRWTGTPARLDAAVAPATADALASWLSDRIAVARAAGVPWQAVFDAFRPHVGSVWRRLPDRERGLFLRDHRALWEVHRHRLERPTWEALRGWLEQGWVLSHAGNVAAAEVGKDGVRVTVEGEDVVEVDRIVLCCGNESDPRRFHGKLWRQLVEDGLVTPDAHGLGIETDDDGRTPGGIWALGGLQRPRWFESTAVPELARQAARAAAAITPR